MSSYIYINAPTIDHTVERMLQSYAITNKLDLPISYFDNESTKLHWTHRKIKDVLSRMKEGDNLIVPDLSQLACSTAQILEILKIASKNAMIIHFVSRKIIFSRDLSIEEILDLILKIESAFVSIRTTVALARRREKGLPLGRPKGKPNKKLKLDKFKEDIDRYVTLGVSKASIAKLVDCHPQTLYDWLDSYKARFNNQQEA